MPRWAQGCASLMSFILASRSRVVAVRSPRASHPESQPPLQNSEAWPWLLHVTQAGDRSPASEDRNQGDDAAASAEASSGAAWLTGNVS